MLMKSPTSPNAARLLAASLGAAFGRLWFSTSQLCRAIKHRRDIAVLADQDDYLLADIGLTRDDLRHAVADRLTRLRPRIEVESSNDAAVRSYA